MNIIDVPFTLNRPITINNLMVGLTKTESIYLHLPVEGSCLVVTLLVVVPAVDVPGKLLTLQLRSYIRPINQDKIACGINDYAIQKRLLAEGDKLTLASIVLGTSF